MSTKEEKNGELTPASPQQKDSSHSKGEKKPKTGSKRLSGNKRGNSKLTAKDLKENLHEVTLSAGRFKFIKPV